MMIWPEVAALATAVGALATAGLAGGTYWVARLAHRSQELAIRPFLAEPKQVALQEALPVEAIQFGVPGRLQIPLPRGSFLAQRREGLFLLSVPFENVGAGTAIIQNASISPPDGFGEVVTSAKVVPVGEQVRVSVAMSVDSPQSDRFSGEWWAMDGVWVGIEYSDSDGSQTLISRLEIRQYATHAPFVEKVAFFHKGKSTPFVEASGMSFFLLSSASRGGSSDPNDLKGRQLV